ncbi:hypothetical protein GUJ93_ZPchr0008g13482 [Zizania palustris]|uniref:Uncharacterized protein n=1 Tax=Zizania palustris TaxID=103762 RepID=A0A8J5RAZ1_ZIZPA|nr:hypothetical protein GUJ93_ZPchr0008g13482 [Zizania palustris]
MLLSSLPSRVTVAATPPSSCRHCRPRPEPSSRLLLSPCYPNIPYMETHNAMITVARGEKGVISYLSSPYTTFSSEPVHHCCSSSRVLTSHHFKCDYSPYRDR